jgi:hypothetical protein
LIHSLTGPLGKPPELKMISNWRRFPKMNDEGAGVSRRLGNLRSYPGLDGTHGVSALPRDWRRLARVLDAAVSVENRDRNLI